MSGIKNKRSSFKGFFASLGILAILGSAFGGYLYFQSNLGSDNKDNTALAATTPVSSFNPSDCTTYTANGGNEASGVCFVKLYEKNGSLYKSLDIAPGEVVKVRNYYNNTTTASVTNTNITDSIPVGFTKIGSVTNNYVDATPVTLNDNVFSGQNLSVAPGAGYFGYGTDNSVTSSNLEFPKVKYIRRSFNGNWDKDGCDLWVSLADPNYNSCPGVSKYAMAPRTTTNGSRLDVSSPTDGWIGTIDITGKRYANATMHGNLDFDVCDFFVSNDPASIACPGLNFALLTDSLNNNTGIFANFDNNSFIGRADLLGNRYLKESIFGNLDFDNCDWWTTNNPSDQGCSGNSWAVLPVQSGLNPESPIHANFSTFVGTVDTLDTTGSRGYGYISYSMQVPTTGVTNGQQKGTTATLAASGNKTSGVLADLTITDVQSPNVSFTKLYSLDGGSTWSPTVTANPGQSVMVRLWSENTGGISATSAKIKDSLPNTFTYVDGSVRNCINPSTSVVTNPDNTELVCDTGTTIQKNSLFTALTNTATTGGVSPSAGLYDGAGATVATGGTAFNAAAGVLEIGKKRYAYYLSTQNCGAGNYRWDGVYNYDTVNNNNGATFLGRPNTSINNICTTFDKIITDTLGKRYAYYISAEDCDSGNYRWDGVYNYDKVNNNNGLNYLGRINNACTTSSKSVIDTLGKRYAYYLTTQNCGAGNYRWDGVYNFDAVNNNNEATFLGRTNASCTTFDKSTIDLLDATRSKTYLQYEMVIPAGTASGNYGTQSTISSTATTAEFPNVTSGANGTGITVTGDPAFSIKKLLALPTSGTGASAVCPTSTSSYSSTLSNTPAGATICVRLAYQNKTSGAVNSAVISDSDISGYLPSGSYPFTFVPGSTINCLTPNTGSEVCTTASGMGGAVPNSAWVRTLPDDTLRLTMTPHAGFYGQASNSTTGTMEMGKKRYLTIDQCNYEDNANADVYGTRNIRAGNSNTIPTTCNTAVNLSTNTLASFLTAGQRYITQGQCNYFNTVSDDNYFYRDVWEFDNTLATTKTCLTVDPSIAALNVNDTKFTFDSLGKRFIHQNQCNFTRIRTTINPGTIDITVADDIINLDNIPTAVAACDPGASNATVGTIDLLDPQNGTGYIQYKISTPTNPTTQSITLPNVSLSGTGQANSTSNAIINFSAIPLTPTDIPGLTVTCPTSAVNTTTTCTFPLPSNKTLPTDFKLTIGTGSINQTTGTAQSCTVTSNIVSCTNVPTGNSIGIIPIYGQFTGTAGSKTATGETVTITGINFAKVDWTFAPDQGSTAPLFRSSDATTVTIRNLKTAFDLTPNLNTRYTCTLEYRALNDRLATTPTWNTVSTTPVAYNTTSGCVFNITKTQRGNNLNYSLRLTITDTTNTSPTASNPNTFILNNEYLYRFQGAGVASGG